MLLPRDVRVGKHILRCTLFKAAAKNVPAGQIHELHPIFPPEVAILVVKQDLHAYN